jgi:hypothetical protein
VEVVPTRMFPRNEVVTAGAGFSYRWTLERTRLLPSSSAVSAMFGMGCAPMTPIMLGAKVIIGNWAAQSLGLSKKSC